MSTFLSKDALKPECSFLSLPEELIVTILLQCGVQDVLRVESTCRFLKHVCDSRALWTTVLETLPIEHTPNLPPSVSLSTASTSSIREAIVRAIAAHDKWTKPSQRPRMTLIEIPLTEPQPTEVNERRLAVDQEGENEEEEPVLPARRGDILVEPRLIPGRPEALVINRGQLELWHTETKQRLWCVPTFNGDFNCFAFDFELAEDANTLFVASADAELGFSTLTPLRIFSYNFASKTSELLYECNMPPVFLFRMMMRGPHVLAPVSPTGAKTMLINWRTQQGTLLQYIDAFGTAYDTRATLLAGSTVVSTLHLPGSGFSAVAVDLSRIEASMRNIPSLIDRNRSGEDIWPTFQIRPSSDEHVACLLLPVPDRQSVPDARNGPFMLAHRVFQKSWINLDSRDSTPTEILLASFDSAIIGAHSSRDEPLRLIAYHLRAAASKDNDHESLKPSLSLIKFTCEAAPQLPWNARSLSNNGHMFSLGDSIRCFSLFSDEGHVGQPAKCIFLPPGAISGRDDLMPVISSVDPWSGSIAIGMPNMLKILRFDGREGDECLLPIPEDESLTPSDT